MLRTIPPKSAVLPVVRESQAVLDAVAREARKAGITDSEAVRQMIEALLDNPRPIDDDEAAALDGYLPPVRADTCLLENIQVYANWAGVSIGAVIRHAIRRYFAEALTTRSQQAGSE